MGGAGRGGSNALLPSESAQMYIASPLHRREKSRECWELPAEELQNNSVGPHTTDTHFIIVKTPSPSARLRKKVSKKSSCNPELSPQLAMPLVAERLVSSLHSSSVRSASSTDKNETKIDVSFQTHSLRFIAFVCVPTMSPPSYLSLSSYTFTTTFSSLSYAPE